jgi:hypothetical protein
VRPSTIRSPLHRCPVWRDIGVRTDDTNTENTWKTWSPDCAFVLQMVAETGTACLVDPDTGAATELPWADDIPDWQRVAR